MSFSDHLTEVFDRAMKDGEHTLSSADHDLFLIQDFILDFEMGSLSSYFYNRLPDTARIEAAVDAMRRNNVAQLGDLLDEALDLFRGYKDADSPTTWAELLHRCDPDGTLQDVESRILSLDNYGLPT
jgi:hypothetical protein